MARLTTRSQSGTVGTASVMHVVNDPSGTPASSKETVDAILALNDARTKTLTNTTLTGAVVNGTLGATTPASVKATTISSTGTVTSGGRTEFGPGAFASGVAAAYTNSDKGLLLICKAGATNDFLLVRPAGQNIMEVTAGTDDVKFSGNVSATGLLTTNGQIKFPATQNASADVNTLDDYEEGTFTPTIVGTTTAGVGTYSPQTGKYSKVGRAVSVLIDIGWSAHTGTGNMNLTNLPFVSSDHTAIAVGYTNGVALTAGNILQGIVFSASNNIELKQTPTGGGAVAAVPIDTTARIMISGTYFV